MILKEAIPSLNCGKSTIPICQFISKCTSSDCINGKVQSFIKHKYSDILSMSENVKISRDGYYEMGSIVNYYKENGLNKTLYKIPLINPSEINVDDLFEFINQAINDTPELLSVEKIHQQRSLFKKCMRLVKIL